MEAFLTFILVTILVIYFLGWIGRIVLRWWVAKKQREFAQRFGEAAGFGGFSESRSHNSQQKKSEGEVKIKRAPSSGKEVNKTIGEYVEYVEIEEETEVSE